MSTKAFYRGGNSLRPRTGEIRIDPVTGLIRTTHGVSVYDRPAGLERFGGAYEMSSLPATLRIVQRGKDPHHHEIVAVSPMPPEEYEAALARIVLTAV